MGDAAKTNKPKWHQIGREAVLLEAKTLSEVSEKLGESFDRIVDAITSLHDGGRLLFVGIGKPSYVGMKLSATFASLSIPSYFLNPTEALHGDLGRITKHDIVIALSLSGETPEIVTTLPFIKQKAHKIFAITQAITSSLGSLSDEVIETGQIEEAWPLRVAPTSSTTAMLAIGDAIAMAVAAAKNIEKSDFAVLHPGGALGRALRPVKEVLRSGEKVCTVSPKTTTREVLHSYTQTPGRPGAAVVVDERGHLLGLFTDGDLRRLLDKGEPFLDRPIESVMNPKPKTIKQTLSIQDALEFLTANTIDQVVVLDDKVQGLVAGLVDIQDVAVIFSATNLR